MAREKGIENSAFHIWTEEEKEYLKKITPGHHYREIQQLMKEKFNLDFTLNQIKGAIGRYKLNTGFKGHFPKGHTPFNKGVKGVIYEGPKKTWFEKGHKPKNHRPVGSERINVDGYTEVKVAEPRKWRLKHQVVWEEHNGTIPKGYAVIFANGDKRNFDIDNLILVSRRQLLVLNNNKLIKESADLTKTGVIIADLLIKISEVKSKDK